MPTYDYECVCCEDTFEFEQSINDPPLRECPSCAMNCLKRLVSAGVPFVLKGDGWAKDGYATKGTSPAKKVTGDE